MSMEMQDIRWEQRFANYKKALAQLQKFIDKGDLTELEEQGLIKAFEYTYELAWNTLKDFLTYQGQTDIYGSRDATRKAFELGLIEDGEIWMEMLASRNKTSCAYDPVVANELSRYIRQKYWKAFVLLRSSLEAM